MSSFLIEMLPLPLARSRCQRLCPVPFGIGKIAADGLFDLFAAVQQPENNEQRHHGRNKIRVGHLPGAAMVAAVAGFLTR